MISEDKNNLLESAYRALENGNERLARTFFDEYILKYDSVLQSIKRDESKNNDVSRKDERLDQTIRDARNQCRRLALMNFDKKSTFLTLTVAKNSDDIDFYDKKFKAFIRKLRIDYGKFHYLGVREFQKRGAIHYHVLIDYPFISGFDENNIRSLEVDFAENYWKQGFVDLKDISHVDNVGAYVVKYMTSELHDKRLLGRKSYLCSQGLNRPEVIKTEFDSEIDDLIAQKKPVFENSYFSEFQGKISYQEFNLDR